MKTITYDETQWNLVPVSPTPEMHIRGGEEFADSVGSGNHDGDTLNNQAHAACIYSAMLDTAPSPPADDPLTAAQQANDRAYAAAHDDQIRAPMPTDGQAQQDQFDGDNSALICSIQALLQLDGTGSLVPHGIGWNARVLLEAAASRLQGADKTGPEAYCEACQSVGIRNCSDFVNCGNARCITCKQFLPTPAQQEPVGDTDGGRNPFYEGRFDGETELEKKARLAAAQQDADKADAQRYRYLRDVAGNGIMGALMAETRSDKWDEIVDAARAKQGGQS